MDLESDHIKKLKVSLLIQLNSIMETMSISKSVEVSSNHIFLKVGFFSPQLHPPPLKNTDNNPYLGNKLAIDKVKSRKSFVKLTRPSIVVSRDVPLSTPKRGIVTKAPKSTKRRLQKNESSSDENIQPRKSSRSSNRYFITAGRFRVECPSQKTSEP